jgi:precorrin-2/cobalt-factor-2 C20-methyltransferase
MRRGKLIGVGVGPGDPELLTVKAVRVINRAPVLAFIGASGRPSRAREIAAAHIAPGTRELVAVMPMGSDPAGTAHAYAQLATGIIGELGQGHDVVFLCEGDPLLYGSFAHLVERLGTRFECEAVPGITSAVAAASATLRPLALREQPLAIIPATMPPRRLEALLKDHERVVILKVGRHVAKVRQALGGARMLKSALLVENVTTADQRVRPLQAVGEEAAPYFSLVLASREPQQR